MFVCVCYRDPHVRVCAIVTPMLVCMCYRDPHVYVCVRVVFEHTLPHRSLRWETHLPNGVCDVQFDRKDIMMNKLLVTGLESKFSVFDLRTYNKEKGCVCWRVGVCCLIYRSFPATCPISFRYPLSAMLPCRPIHYALYKHATDSRRSQRKVTSPLSGAAPTSHKTGTCSSHQGAMGRCTCGSTNTQARAPRRPRINQNQRVWRARWRS